LIFSLPWDHAPHSQFFALYFLGLILHGLFTLGVHRKEILSIRLPRSIRPLEEGTARKLCEAVLSTFGAQTAWSKRGAEQELKVQFHARVRGRRFSRAQPDLRRVLESRLAPQTDPIVGPETPLSEFTQKVLLELRMKKRDLHFGATELARALGLSKRTLERKLREDHLSLRKIKQQLRIEMAAELLKVGLDAKVVAQQVGFADHSSFSRAFRRWTGTPPSQYKKAVK
jgi:AraC-like DNA-binding protein